MHAKLYQINKQKKNMYCKVILVNFVYNFMRLSMWKDKDG